MKLYCGVLPQNPKPPFNYKLTFNIEGLLTEYDYRAIVLRNGDIVEVETLAELEDLEIEGLGKMEAFTTSGGTSTAPYSLQGKIQNYEYKTIRFPGHCERMRIFKDFGFWGEEPVEVKGCMVRPREVFYKVFGPKLAAIQDLDQCLVRGVAVGTRNGKRVRSQIDIHDRQCEQTGFTAMERTTGFSIAIHAAAIARGEIRKGAVRYEQALTGSAFLDQIRRRGIHLRTSEEPIDH